MPFNFKSGPTREDDPFTGADVIVRKAQSFMTGQVAPTSIVPRQTTRDEALRLAHDDIGACEGVQLFYQVHILKSMGLCCQPPHKVSWEALLALRGDDNYHLIAR